MSAVTRHRTSLSSLPLLLSICLCPSRCQCAIFHVESSYPFISVQGQPVDWHSGAAAQWALSSLLVRIHSRGVMFKKQTWHIRDLAGVGWIAESCVFSAHGLCQTTRSVFFPSSQSPEVNEAMTRQCASTDTQRVITNESRYDHSACDVLDRHMDYVFVREVVYFSDTSMEDWVYWAVCILVVFLVRCLSRYTLATTRTTGEIKKGNTTKDSSSATQSKNNPAGPAPWVSLTASSACALLVIFQGDSMYITHEELIFYWFTVFYVFAYTCLFVGVKAFKQISRAAINDPPFYNLLSGVLQLVSSRLYSGAETPYNPPLLFVIAMRALAKSRREPNMIRGITLILDALMLSLMSVLGFGPDPLYLIALFTGAWAWADLLDTQTETKNSVDNNLFVK